jgi:predicted nucleotidyltransferase component of viral defense system
MDLSQLNQFKKELKISNDKIVREEAEMIFLNELAQDDLGLKVVFYGGTALRLVYGSPRFSEDIDLLELKKIDFDKFGKFVKNLAKRQNWALDDIKNKRQTIFALFKIKDGNLKHPFSLKIEIHKPARKRKLETTLSLIKSPVSVLSPLLLTVTLAELKRLKEAAIADRKKARDIFDLWYISRALKTDFILPPFTPKFKEQEVANELRVFLPPKFHPIIKQLYEQITKRNKKTA